MTSRTTPSTDPVSVVGRKLTSNNATNKNLLSNTRFQLIAVQSKCHWASALPLTKPAFKSTPLRLEPRNKNINSDLGKYSAAAEFLSDGAVDQAKLSEQRPVRRRPGR
ncbi:MAG TPA: hypothetical protein PK992_18905 [Planctomycetaceae bacterium]|nr:hypothetical protein [Planctomycetaceae bacterium]